MAKKIVALIMSILPYLILLGFLFWPTVDISAYSPKTFGIATLVIMFFFYIWEMLSFVMSVGSKAVEIITKLGGLVAKISEWAWYLIPFFPIDVFIGLSGLIISLFIVLEGFAILSLVTPVVCLISLIVYLFKKYVLKS